MADQTDTTASHVSTVQSPPTSVGGILRRLGPGLIIAASIVGSGELIATTKTGAEAGIWLLWLIVIGCVIKVFVQVEFGRFAIAEGRTTMDGMNQVPGPRLRVSWLMWYWLLMFALGLGQLGAIVGGVGQSLAMTMPLTGDFNELLAEQRAYDEQQRNTLSPEAIDAAGDPEIDEPTPAVEAAPPGPRPDAYTRDDVYWSAIVTLITAVLLVNGRYRLIQNVATVLVAGFTALTIFNLFALQSHAEWAFSWSEIRAGLSGRLPPNRPGISPLGTALAAFGIIGVGASELIAYPYWCLERGYARYTGRRDHEPGWAERARGWLRVMRWDAWCSMVIYTLATVAFYLLGAGVLHRSGLNPAGNQMIATLAQMYEPVFGAWAAWVFLIGAVAVLYSTFFVATAGNSRMASDAVRVFGLGARDDATRQWWTRLFCAAFPFISLSIYSIVKQPVLLVLISGLAQSIMLPMLGAAGLFFRYRRCDARIVPGRLWDAMLWLSFGGLLITGLWGGYSEVGKLAAQLGAALRQVFAS